MNPWSLPRWTVVIALWGYGLYVRLFGRRTALKLVGAGLVVSTIAAVILEQTT